ncbi:MAG: hypothetical protein M1591_07125 [Deltaproteobacteria bacterium]|nr:hypothetical protein [Deltaproteobacteria bacterium]
MKYGYSMLLGEHIEAEKINYDDCKALQIVCPSCNEPIFKVTRNNQTPDMIEYLSHYEKGASYASDCELRVNALKPSEVAVTNTQSRNQRLQYFLNVLRDVIIKNEFDDKTNYSGDIFRQMKKAPMMEFVRNEFHWNICNDADLNTQNNIYKEFDHYITDITVTGGSIPMTGFTLTTQKRIAFDIWKHLLSDNARSNFNYLYNYSYFNLLRRLKLTIDSNTIDHNSQLWKQARTLYSCMGDIIYMSEREGRQLITAMKNYEIPPSYPGDKGLNLLIDMYSNTLHEMFGCLIRLPYFDILKTYNTSTTNQHE